MYVAIGIMTLLTIAVAAFLLAPRMAPSRLVFDAAPDRPHPFGYGMSWLAIRTRDTGAVIDRLALQSAETANWKSGLGAVYDDYLGASRIFVSPPVNGWTFVVGAALPGPMGRRFVDKCVPLLLDLGQHFVEVQYYSNHADIDYFAWARVIEGRLIRAFAINDEGVIWNRGKPTREEKAMGLKLFEVRGVRGRTGDAGGEILLYPTDQHIMQLAAKWSIDPTSLAAIAATPANGIIAFAPAHWRTERLAKAA